MGRRTLLLVVALLLSAVGSVLVYAYAQGADDRAREGQQTRSVLVANTLIVPGTSVDQILADGSAQSEELVSEAVADGALSDLSTVSDSVVLSSIYPGQQIVAAAFGSREGVAGIPIPEGKMAISVQLSDPQRVAGFVSPGTQVAVFATLDDPDPAPGEAGSDVTTLLLPRVSVITTGSVNPEPASSSSTDNTEDIPRAVVTLAVTQAEAERLILASSKGQLYLALLSPQSSPKPGPGTSVDDLFGPLVSASPAPSGAATPSPTPSGSASAG